ncbi:MAG: hypothetical protein HDR88_03420 [Bacteroides sp.]|nr:hypothetical protein [Bacteroides sp.]
MKELLILLALISTFSVKSIAQTINNGKNEEFTSMTYRQVNEVRQELGLDHKQFDKVYDAYNKYNETVFGSIDQPRLAPPSKDMGRPGDHGGPGHDMGGGRPPMGGPGMGMPPSEKNSKKWNPEKIEKTKIKQEEKLRKSMKKILKTQDLYDRWLKIRERQLVPPIKKEDPNLN